MHAQSDVLPFYKKMGFIKEGEEFKEAGIMHFKMTLKY
jgi:predicted GNAT family N-acyltransferase